MELWIRSQDKHNLVKANNLSISHDFDYKVNEHYYAIQEHEYSTKLGYYETKERALEVLNEIQEFIEKRGENYLLTNKDGIITGQKHYGLVYEMPEQ